MVKLEFYSRSEWLAARRKFIGASDSAAILGVGYADSGLHTVWSDKVIGREDSPDVDKRLKIGLLMEPTLRQVFTLETGLPCEPAGQYTIYRHPEVPYLSATLDGWTEDPDVGPCPVELKNVDAFNRSEWNDDEPPLKFNVQVQHQMMVTEKPRAYLLALIGGNYPVVKRVERNDAFIEGLKAKLAEFWSYVERERLPPVDASIGASHVLAQLYPHDSGETVALPAELSEIHDELESSKEDLKSAEERKRFAENKIKAAIGEATFGAIPGVDGYYSWREQSRVLTCPHCHEITSESRFRVLRKVKRR